MTAIAHSFSPWSLGAPLYMPAHRRDLMDCANGEKWPLLRSMIFCTEDAIAEADVDSSLRHLGLCLQGFKDAPQRHRFIRVRNPDVLARLLLLPDIERIDGFVLPKFNMQVFNAYLDQLQGTTFKIMPTLETKDVFDGGAMIELRQALLHHALLPHIAMLRIGGNDLMSLLGIRRPRYLTLYDTPLGQVIAQLVTIFKPYGFSLSSPVFEYLDDRLTLEKEIHLDLAHGLNGKSGIHPAQIATIEAMYHVEPEDYAMAVKLLDEQAPAVFKMHNAMCEVATHLHWARDIVTRYQHYGLRDALSTQDFVECSYL